MQNCDKRCSGSADQTCKALLEVIHSPFGNHVVVCLIARNSHCKKGF